MLTELATLRRDADLLCFAYRGHGGTVTRRTAEPHRLVRSGRRWYLAARDPDRAAWRTFRADRVTPRPPHGPRFGPREPPARDLAAYVSRGVSTRAYASHAVIRLPVPVEEAAERIAPTDGTLEAEGPDRCVLRTGAGGLDATVVHVRMPGFEFEVPEPAGLVDAIRTARDRLTRSVARSSQRDRGAGGPRPRRAAGRRVRHVGGSVGSCGGIACLPCPPVSVLVRGGETEWLPGHFTRPFSPGRSRPRRARGNCVRMPAKGVRNRPSA